MNEKGGMETLPFSCQAFFARMVENKMEDHSSENRLILAGETSETGVMKTESKRMSNSNVSLH